MKKYLKVVLILAILLLILIPTLTALKFFVYKDIYNHYVNSIQDLTGLNTYLVKAVLALLIIPFFLGIRYIFSRTKKQRLIGGAVVVAYIIIYNITLFGLTKNQNFKFADGEAIKWYAITPDGINYYDKPGVDPIYGIKLKKVTPAVIKNLKLVEGKPHKSVDPENASFFNPITGEPTVWYTNLEDGSYAFFDKPGYHPVVGKALLPVSIEAISKWKAFRNLQIKIKKNDKIKNLQLEEIRNKKEKQRIEIATRKDEKRIKKEEELSRQRKLLKLINPSAIIKNEKNIALIIGTNNSGKSDLYNTNTIIANQLRNYNNHLNLIDDFFNMSFFNNNHFSNVSNGDYRIFNELNTKLYLDNIIVGNLNYSINNSMEGIFSCSIELSFKVLNNSNQIINSGRLSVAGPGHSENDALKRGIEMLVETYHAKILKNI